MVRHYPITAQAVALSSRSDRDRLRTRLRWLIFGAAACVLVVVALSRAGAVGAAAPADCIPINYTTCVSNGVFYTNGNPGSSIAPTYIAPAYTYVAPAYTYVAPAYVAPSTTSTGYPANTVISTYYDPRYGVVSIVTDQYGNLINVNAATGQRIYPVFPDYGYPYGYVNGYYRGVPYVYPNIAGCPSGNYSCLGNYYGGYYPYYTGAYRGNYTVVAPSNNLITVGAPYRVTEVSQPAATPGALAQPPAAPVPVAQAAPAVQTAVPATLPTANVASGLNTPLTQAPTASSGGAGVKVLSVQTTAPAVATNDGREDGK